MSVEKKSANEISNTLKKLTLNFNKKEMERRTSQKESKAVKDKRKEYYMFALPNAAKSGIDEATNPILNGLFLMDEMNKIIKKTKGKTPEEIRKYYMKKLPEVFSIINKIDKKIRERFKKHQMNQLLKNYPFAIASQHSDCAKDHLSSQGKLYYNERYIHKKEVKQIVAQRNLQSIQYVTGKPIYFVTRPYCRHYFEGVDLKDVKNNTYTIPTKTYGDYKYQNPAGNQSLYEERLKLFKKMYKKHPTEDLRILINKTKIIVERWKIYNKTGK